VEGQQLLLPVERDKKEEWLLPTVWYRKPGVFWLLITTNTHLHLRPTTFLAFPLRFARWLTIYSNIFLPLKVFRSPLSLSAYSSNLFIYLFFYIPTDMSYKCWLTMYQEIIIDHYVTRQCLQNFNLLESRKDIL